MIRILANFVSWLLNPGCLLLTIVAAGVGLSHLRGQTALAWFIAIGLVAFTGTIIVGIAWVRGAVLDADLMTPTNLWDRSKLVIVFASLVLFLIIGTFRTGQPQPLHALLVTLLLVGILVSMISSRWKISLHMVGASILCTVLILLGGIGWWPLVLLIPCIAWARLALGRHTSLQLLAGVLVGVSITSIIFWSYNLL